MGLMLCVGFQMKPFEWKANLLLANWQLFMMLNNMEKY